MPILGRLPRVEEFLAIEAGIHEHVAPAWSLQQPYHHRDVDRARRVGARDQLMNGKARNGRVADRVDLPGRAAECRWSLRRAGQREAGEKREKDGPLES